jgi:hypothetical protein
MPNQNNIWEEKAWSMLYKNASKGITIFDVEHYKKKLGWILKGEIGQFTGFKFIHG